MRVELVYDRECPNVAATRENLVRALELANYAPNWKEWEQSSPAAPAYPRRYGSPTVLVDGHDIAEGEHESDGACCRFYHSTDNGSGGVPSIALILAALEISSEGREGSR